MVRILKTGPAELTMSFCESSAGSLQSNPAEKVDADHPFPQGSTPFTGRPFTGEPDNEILDPTTGELVCIDDIDGLIDMYERCKHTNDVCYAVQIKVRELLAGMTEGDSKTRRVRGNRRQAVISMPDDAWDQASLKRAFAEYPKYRDQVLKIDSVRVLLREFKKIVGTTGPADFNDFRDIVSAANRGPCGTPTIKIES